MGLDLRPCLKIITPGPFSGCQLLMFFVVRASRTENMTDSVDKGPSRLSVVQGGGGCGAFLLLKENVDTLEEDRLESCQLRIHDLYPEALKPAKGFVRFRQHDCTFAR